MTAALVRVQDLSITYADRGAAAVRDVSLHVQPGEFHGLVGESGSGKSTIARALLGLTDRGSKVLGGSVVIDGLELLGLSNRRLRSLRGHKVAYIGQNPFGALHPVLRIERHFELMRRAHRGLLDRAGGRARAIDLLDQVGFRDPAAILRSYVHQLSGGMAQRIVIALAMYLEPDLIVADEPTTGLDVTIQRQILDLLTEQARARGAGLLLITHDLGVVAQYCDTVTVLYGGRVMEAGPVRGVLTEPQHPYTRALVSAVPVPGVPLARTPATNYPVLDEGCPFRERCPAAALTCAAHPPVVEVAPGWRSNCHFAGTEA
jgi:oligopeptide/dipeptide ABC transporter ATP-binding protein